jgi:putative DNA primase/helicase
MTQHASYIASWIKPLKEDKREIFRAAADAQRIAAMEFGFHPNNSAQGELDPVRPAPRAGEMHDPRPAPE